MPFIRNTVEPECIRQGLKTSKDDEKTILQDYMNYALVNIIRQLASLTSKVDIVFGSLIAETEDMTRRLQNFKSKLKDIEEKLQNLDTRNEIVGKGLGKDKRTVYKAIVDRNNFFQSEKHLESGKFMEESAPKEVQLLRESAEPMPRLQDLDDYRTDGKLCAKFYSDPNLFYLAWQESLQKMIAEQHARSLMKAKKSVRQTNLRRVRKAKASRFIEAQKRKMGVELATNNRESVDDEEEYFSEGEWSDTDDEDDGPIVQYQGNGSIATNSKLSVLKNQHRLSSFGDYKFQDIEETDIAMGLHPLTVRMPDDEIEIPVFSTNTDDNAQEYGSKFSIDAMRTLRLDSTDMT